MLGSGLLRALPSQRWRNSAIPFFCDWSCCICVPGVLPLLLTLSESPCCPITPCLSSRPAWWSTKCCRPLIASQLLQNHGRQDRHVRPAPPSPPTSTAAITVCSPICLGRA